MLKALPARARTNGVTAAAGQAFGLQGYSIPLWVRLLAMTEFCDDKPTMSHAAASDEFFQGIGSRSFDVVEAFIVVQKFSAKSLRTTMPDAT